MFIKPTILSFAALGLSFGAFAQPLPTNIFPTATIVEQGSALRLRIDNTDGKPILCRTVNVVANYKDEASGVELDQNLTAYSVYIGARSFRTVVVGRQETQFIRTSDFPNARIVKLDTLKLASQNDCIYIANHEVPSSLVSGRSHNCILTDDDGVACFGQNYYGQLGNGKESWETAPSRITGLDWVQELAAGDYHSCAVDKFGEVYCWGVNEKGQLGIGDTLNQNTPKRVPGLSQISGLTLGTEHSCAIGPSKEVLCWGNNDSGQLGNQTTNNSSFPVKVYGLPAVKKLAASDDATCAITEQGDLYCWGWLLGTVPSGDMYSSSTPYKVPNLPKLKDFDLGRNHACAVSENSDVFCWGNNGYGATGLGKEESTDAPLSQVPGLSGVYMLDIAESTTCAANLLGELYCWGENSDGQLGNNSTINSAVPKKVMGIDPVREFSLGPYFTCAISQKNEFYCWGLNYAYGDGSSDSSSVPRKIKLQNVGSITYSESSTVAKATFEWKSFDDKYHQCWKTQNGVSEKVNNSDCGQPTRILEMSKKFCSIYENGIYVSSLLRGQTDECPVL